jgi:tRNA-2-methylthio-N6-dimethylallyladenosine synthase
MVTVVITDAAPYHLLADNQKNYSVRRTIAGDAWDRAEAAACAVPSTDGGAKSSVSLGIPSVGLPTIGQPKAAHEHAGHSHQ